MVKLFEQFTPMVTWKTTRSLLVLNKATNIEKQKVQLFDGTPPGSNQKQGVHISPTWDRIQAWQRFGVENSDKPTKPK